MGGILHHTHTAQGEGESQNLMNVLSENHWMTDFIEALADSTIAPPVSFFIRDTSNSKYLFANMGAAKLCGVESVSDLIGLDIHEFWIEDVHHRKDKLHLSGTVLQWEEEEVKKAEQREAQVCSTKLPLDINGVGLTYDNFIRWANLKKLPVLDCNKEKVIATVTLTQDLTSQIPLPDLFQFYRHYYPDSQAIQQLLKYLKIDSYFSLFPSVRETQILLALCRQFNRKKVARLLNISSNTLASHLQHLKDKLIVPDINELLMQLRTASMNQRPSSPLCASKSA